MSASAVGVIFSNLHEENVPELVRRRTMASIPFGGRYRLIDFPLSNMVNAGIMTVGLMANNNYRSLIDHLGSGKDWDLARKDGGIILLPPFSDESEKLYTTRLEALKGLTSFLNRRQENYVVFSDCDGVARMNISDILAYHQSKNADITMVKTANYMIIGADKEGRVNEVKISPRIRSKTKADVYVNVMVFNRQFLLNLVEDAVTHGYTCFESDIVAKQLDSLKIYRYDFRGYYAGINSMAAYYKHNMELLEKTVRDELFGARDIYTKVRDSAPSKYGEETVVKNSLISDGCEIEGRVENSILFRGVKVAKGACVRNSIIMQDTIIGSNASLDCVITDKNVVIADRRKLSGCELLPYFIQKGTML